LGFAKPVERVTARKVVHHRLKFCCDQTIL
jgi:hypothetical protein